MKETIEKIVILCCVIVGAIIGIGCYYKTRMAPPRDLEFPNKHVAEVKNIALAFDTLLTDDSQDSLLFLMHDKIELYNREQYVTSIERDELMEIMANEYVPKFIESSMHKFELHTWYHKDRERMTKKIAEFKSYKINGGVDDLITGEYLQSFNKISNIIKRYNEAWHVTQVSRYRNITQARSVINSVRKYSEMEYLRNYDKLVGDLKNVPKRLEKSHYQILQSSVSELDGGYWNLTKDEYMKKISDVENMISIYNDNATSLYGKKSNTSVLKNQLYRYRNEANTYYEPQQSKTSYSNNYYHRY